MDKEFTLKVGELALLETLPGCSKQMRRGIPDYWPTALIHQLAGPVDELPAPAIN
jgi:predicted phosphohydrolase